MLGWLLLLCVLLHCILFSLSISPSFLVLYMRADFIYEFVLPWADFGNADMIEILEHRDQLFMSAKHGMWIAF